MNESGSDPFDEYVEDEEPERLVGRSAARSAAIQALYESDLSNRRVEGCVSWIAGEEGLGGKQREFAHALATEVESNRDGLDHLLNGYAKRWSMESASPVVRNVLRVALAEGRLNAETSDAVIISEAVKLAKRFDTEGAARFVNGILGAMARDEKFRPSRD